MRYYLLLPILIFNYTVNSYAQDKTSAEQKIVQQVVTGLFDGLAELDVDKAKSFCTPDVRILENGAVWNFDSLALRITTRKAKSGDFKRVNKFEFLNTKVSGNTAWLYYLNHATISYSGKTVVVKWLESAILKKESKDWKIDLLHSTELERTSY